MADNDLKIWQNYLLPNPFHVVDAKFDLVLRPISHGNPAMPLELQIIEKNEQNSKINVNIAGDFRVYEYSVGVIELSNSAMSFQSKLIAKRLLTNRCISVKLLSKAPRPGQVVYPIQ